MATSIKDVIKRCEFFWSLSDTQMEELAYLAVQQAFQAGQRIITEGEPLPNFYIVVKGKVALEMEIRIGSRTRRQAVVDVVVRPPSKDGWMNTLMYSLIATRASIRARRRKKLSFGPTMDA